MAGKKILVADDSLTIQKVIRLALSGDGYEIQTVSDGHDAVEQTSLFRPDICIIDVSLPGKDAYQIRQEFMSKPDLKNIPVILMSSAFEKVDELKMSSLGFAGHLIKPFDPSHLRSTLLAVSSQNPPIDTLSESINPDPEMKEIKTGSIKFDPPPVNKLEADSGFSLEPTKTDIQMKPLKEYREQVKAKPTPPPAATPEPSLPDLPPLSFESNDSEAGGDDIQKLAKSTFEMSGLDQQDWGVIEPMKEESFASAKTGMIERPIQFSAGNTEAVNPYEAPPSASLSQEEVAELVKAEVTKHLQQMQNEIKTRVQAIFDEEYKHYTQAKMPELAEKVIKEEIHRLLTEPPI